MQILKSICNLHTMYIGIVLMYPYVYVHKIRELNHRVNHGVYFEVGRYLTPEALLLIWRDVQFERQMMIGSVRTRNILMSRLT